MRVRVIAVMNKISFRKSRWVSRRRFWGFGGSAPISKREISTEDVIKKIYEGEGDSSNE
jgi:hypothetical protein